MLLITTGRAAPFVKDIAPPAQSWSFQKAGNPQDGPQKDAWLPLEKFRNLYKPDASGPEVNSVWYETDLVIPPEARDRSVWLGFQHLRGVARVFVNGAFVKEVSRTDGEVDLSKFVAPGRPAKLRVFVTRSGEGTDSPPSDDLITSKVMRKYYSLSLPRALGLMGRVDLILRGRTSWLTSAWVECFWSPRSIKVHAEGGGLEAEGLRVTGEIVDAEGRTALKLPAVPFQAGEAELASAWDNVVPWELGKGTLYTLRLRLIGRDGKTLDELAPVVFGFREIRVEGRNFLINGAPVRWRLSPIIWFDTLRRGSDNEPGSLKAINFLSETGFNVLEVQPHYGSFWSRDFGPWPVYDEDLIAEADKKGIGLTLAAPHFTKHWVDFGVGSEAAVRAQYRREFESFIRRYRNHPSILAWVGAMNFFDVDYGALANAPWGMGTDPTPRQKSRHVHQTILNGERIMEALDPSRPSYSHHAGNSGAIASSNQHMCMTPMAELEKWPSEWARQGTKPWIAVEFATPYWADFWMKNRSERTGNIEPFGEAAITEFAALTLGDEAYEMETESLRKRLPSLTRANVSGHGSEKVPPAPLLRVDGNILDLPAVRAVFAEYGRRVQRSWRTWGVTGWSPWLLSWGLRYRGNPESFMPDVVKAFREVNQPLLAYIGGTPEFYHRQRNYRSGEPVNKTAVFVWDGPRVENLEATWEASVNGTKVAEGRFQQKLEPQSVTKLPISFPAPSVTEKSPLEIRLLSREGNETIETATVWPATDPAPKLERRVVVFDPAGDSTWVSAVVPGVQAVSGDAIAGLDPAGTVLVLGRRSLQHLDRLPYSLEQIAAGLRVILLEQTQADLQRLGLRSAERGIREGMGILPSSPILAGLTAEDFRDWRGSATLLPEKDDFRWWTDLDKLDAFNPARSARWGTHGNVSSVQIETPQKGNFIPLLRCGFDMAYSPLLEWRHGLGGVWFCQLDLTGRVGPEPAASRLASNLLTTTAGTLPPANRALLTADLGESLTKKIADLGFRQAPEAGENVLQVTTKPTEQGFQVAGEKGGTAPEGTAWIGLTRIADGQIQMPPGTEPPPNLRRFRMTIDALERTDSMVLAFSGKSGFLGVPLNAADGPYADEVEKNHARLTRWRIRQLYGWMFSQAGVESSPEVAGRLTELISPKGKSTDASSGEIALQLLRDVKISQAIRIPDLQDGALLDVPLPALVFKDQKTLSAAKDAFSYGGEDATGGYLDLAKLLDATPASGLVAVVTATVHVPDDRELTVHFGADYWGSVQVNGEEVLRLDAPSGPPHRDAVRKSVRFKAGANDIQLRVVSGSMGFGCWLDVSESTGPLPKRVATSIGQEPFWGSAMLPYDAPGFSLYTEPMRKRDDPYAWKSW